MVLLLDSSGTLMDRPTGRVGDHPFGQSIF